jgi:hypothetical protein
MLNVDKIINLNKGVGRAKLKRIMKADWKDIYTNEYKDKDKKKELDKLFDKEIEKYAPKPKKMVKIKPTRLGTNMYANFIGRWYFDIVYGHNKPEKIKGKFSKKINNNKVKLTDGFADDVIWKTKQDIFGVFVNANSKYAIGMLMKGKSKEECIEAFRKFDAILVDEHIPKAVEIVTDMEKGITAMYDNRIKQFVAKENHHILGPVDGFVNALRQWNWKITGEKAVDYNHFQVFIKDVWNIDIVPGTEFRRCDMVKDPNKEECYICSQIYNNQTKIKNREAIVSGSSVGSKVLLTYANKKEPFERRPGKLMLGKYTILGHGKDGKVEVEDEKGEKKDVYYTQIVKTEPGTANKIDEGMKMIYEPIVNIPNVDKVAKLYEQELQGLKDNLNMEILREIKNRNANDLRLGFMPMVRTEELNIAFKQAKDEYEINKRAPIVGYKKDNKVHKSSVKQLAKDVVSTIFNEKAILEPKGQKLEGGDILIRRRRERRNVPELAVEPHIGND